MIRSFLQNDIIVTDGATGTYYAQLTGNFNSFCELANLSRPELVRQLHLDYIQAGAGLIRTNTFSANPETLHLSREQTRELLIQGWRIAHSAAQGKKVFVAANIGPIPLGTSDPAGLEAFPLLDQYRFLVDVFLEEGADIFNFETFSSLDELAEIAAYIKSQNKEAWVLTQFAINADGFTRKGIAAERIYRQVREISAIDAYGFNCGVGPTHLRNVLKTFDFSRDVVATLPNAGYPEVINERTVYTHNPDYFADQILPLKHLGVKILGGCCGTTPLHIQALTQKLRQSQESAPALFISSPPQPQAVPALAGNRFAEKLARGKFVIAAELDPPVDTAVHKILHGASVYRDVGVDIITVADSPLGKPRVDSVAIAAKIQREIGIDTLPHLCCRDKNLNGLKSSTLAAHIEGIRNILAVTGDPLPLFSKNEIKSVFNLNSSQFIKFLSEMNTSVFQADPLAIGGALNLNVSRKECEIQRMVKKMDHGASFFLTQPIFNQDVLEFLPKIPRTGKVKILGGILPIVNYRNALFLKNELPGITIADEYLNRFDMEMDRETAESAGIELAVEIASKMKPFVDGFYFITPFNRSEMVAKILKRLQPLD